MNESGRGLSLMAVVGLIFLTLKLCGVIDWPWWVVLLPLYGPFVVAGGVICLLLTSLLVLFLAALLFGKDKFK